MPPAAKSFLGTGWSFPPTFVAGGYGVVMVSDDADIRESLWILLSTAQGERIMLPTYGSQLSQMVFRALTTTLATEIEDAVAQAILMWEPRVSVTAITVSRDDAVHGLVSIDVAYVIRRTNVRSNLVYPFYTLEMTIPPPPV